MSTNEASVRARLEENGQEHVLRFVDSLDDESRARLFDQAGGVDFALMGRLIRQWVDQEREPESFDRIDPVRTIPIANARRHDAREAWNAGEEALRAGRVGLLLVAGGQGTRLGFEGPKGAYPIGPLSGRSLFSYHADKIHNLQRRYGCTLPWFIMVSSANAQATQHFFDENGCFGLDKRDVTFFTQRMVPCVDEEGKFILDAPDRLAMNPNGHGGSIPAVVENGILDECRRRGVDTLSYFQVDNWAVKAADPFFIGYHVLRDGEMSSKVHRKTEVREPVGVHCLCDGEYRVIEYTALDIYPQLLETNPDGTPRHYAGNPAIHILDTGFIQRVYQNYEDFPWWRAHKRIPFLDRDGRLVKPEKPNGYKFETFVFDALRFTRHEPIALEIQREGEYTPIKQAEGGNSVQAARRSMRRHWGNWLDEAGSPVPRDDAGEPAIEIEISPRFALSKEEFIERSRGRRWPVERDLAVGPDGEPTPPPE